MKIFSNHLKMLSFLLFTLWALLSTGCCFLSSPDTPPPPAQLTLNGTWKIHPAEHNPTQLYRAQTEDMDWRSVSVPSNWYLQGIDQAGGNFWYRKTFVVDPLWQGKVVDLVFEGVDYTADVWLNNQYLGFHEGYFSPFRFDVSQFIEFTEDNTLAVLVRSTMEEPGRIWSLNKRQIKGVLNHHDTRPGGAWSLQGQDKNTGGIWAPVFLTANEQVNISSMKITPRLADKGEKAYADIEMTVACRGGHGKDNCSDTTVELQLWTQNFNQSDSPVARRHERLNLSPGNNILQFTLPVDTVQLWWPWELGPQNLYRMVATIGQRHRVLDKSSEIFGFRSVSYDPKQKLWKINGKRFFFRGTNYIGSTWLSELTRDRLSKDIELMKDANINAIRVHAHITAPDFYSLCDEMGLLVWQDFPLQWGYEDSDRFLHEAKKQATEMINLLYNHPSVFAWCGHNEPPWDADWMQYKYPRYTPDQNRVLDEELFHHMENLDTSRYVQKHSATSEHPWLGWYSGSWLDYAKPTDRPLISEFGAQALPSRATLKKIFKPEELWPQTEKDWEVWKYHNFQPHETFKLAGVTKGHNLDEFIHNSQVYQAKLIQLAAESYRRQRFAPVAGIFQFMFVEHWPSINWGVVDYKRHLKPGYVALKTAYQPFLPSLAFDTFNWSQGESVAADLYLINDLQQNFDELSLNIVLRADSGLVIEQRRLAASVLADTVKLLGKQTWKQLSSGNYVIEIIASDKTAKVLAENTYAFTVRE